MDESRPLCNLSDEELADGCRHGDRDCQGELYARTSERIYRLLLRITHDAEHAFDLSQDAYVRVFTRIHEFDGHSSLTTWLYRIAVNEALQFMRRAATVRASLERVPDRAPREFKDEQTAARIDVAEALATLTVADRAILLLRYQEGLDYKTIAEVTDCPAGTVASRLNRARERIRSLLKGGYGGREENKRPTHPMIEGSSAVGEPDEPMVPNAGRAGAKSP